MDQLKKTPAHISILELLRLSATHREILDKALNEMYVPTNLNQDQFQAMVRHLTMPHLSFTEHDDLSIHQPHNAPLHIDVLVHSHKIKRVLIDGGAGLNICTLKLVLALGFSKDAVDPKKKIIIRAYDEEERSSKGSVILPISVGPVVRDVPFQVLDMDLSYNILLGYP